MTPDSHYFGAGSFPSSCGRILLGPDAVDMSGGGAGGVDPASPADSVVDGLNGQQAAVGREDLFNAAGATGGDAGTGTTTASTAAPIPADPNVAAATAQPAADQWQSIRDAAAAYGHTFGPEVTDDRLALQQLLQAAGAKKQEDYYAQLGRQLAPQYQGIQNYLKQQTAAVAAPPAPPSWQPPPFDERWGALVVKDEQAGVFVSKPGVSPEIAEAVNKYVDWTTNFQKDPAGSIQPMVEERAKAIAKEAIREHFAQQQQQSAVQQIADTNAAWLFANDPSGNRIIGPNGRPALSPVGAQYIKNLQLVTQSGVTDPRMQDSLAQKLTQNGIYAAHAASAAGQAAQAANPQTQAAVGQPNVNLLQSLPPAARAANPAATEPTSVGLSLADMIRKSFAAEGVSDADFASRD